MTWARRSLSWLIHPLQSPCSAAFQVWVWSPDHSDSKRPSGFITSSHPTGEFTEGTPMESALRSVDRSFRIKFFKY